METLRKATNVERQCTLSHIQIKQEDSADAIGRQREEEKARARVNYQHQSVSALSDERNEGPSAPTSASKEGEKKKSPFVRDIPKVGRNDPCPCGSGKKFKLCCGKIG